MHILDCVKTYTTYNFRGPTQKPAQPEDPFILTKTLQQLAMDTGELVLRPLQTKPLSYVRVDTMVGPDI